MIGDCLKIRCTGMTCRLNPHKASLTAFLQQLQNMTSFMPYVNLSFDMKLQDILGGGEKHQQHGGHIIFIHRYILPAIRGL